VTTIARASKTGLPDRPLMKTVVALSMFSTSALSRFFWRPLSGLRAQIAPS
jgi:hypothetical protein